MTAALEDVKTVEIAAWKTLNTASSPTKLIPGQSPNMQNVWVDEKPGSVITANGLIKVGTNPSGNPTTFCINYFKTSAGTQTFVLSDNSTVWTTVDFQNFTSIVTGLSSAFQLRGLVIRDKLWLTNGSDSVRVYDGSTVTVLDGTGGTPTVPKGRYISYHDERVWLFHIPSNRSQVAFSALTDSSGTIIAPDNASAWPSSNTLQIAEGDADFGTGLLLYRGYMHFFKQYTIWRLVGYDEYTYTRVKTRASTGTRFNESIQVLDNLVHFIGTDGIYVFDGEDTNRISDIIDPASTSQVSFGFNDLQQPNTNNTFWEVSTTADWNAGTVPTNVTIADSLTLKAKDDSKADFDAGNTLTNIDTSDTTGSIVLSRQSSGGSGVRVGQGINAFFDDSRNSEPTYGSASWLTDGDDSRYAGMGVRSSSSVIREAMTIDLTSDHSHVNVGRIIVDNWQTDASGLNVSIQVNTGTYQTQYGAEGTWVTVGSITSGQGYLWNPTTLTFDFTTKSAVQIRILIQAQTGSYQCTEIKAYSPTYNLTGQFISSAVDMGAVPASFGNFNADYSANGQTLTFYTQSSSDGSSWDAAVAVTNGGAIGSTVKRYLRWRADFASDGSASPIINSVWLPALYISAIHDTGGNIFAWGAFEAERSPAGETINFYYRGATTSGGVTSASWNLIVPGGALSISTTFRYIQFKIEVLGGNTSTVPVINSVTINWVVGSGVQPQTLQNVASAVWHNRYWLSAASSGATANDAILIRGKKTFESPWMLKDWAILSFTRYQSNFYGCSSVDGSIYRLDEGFSKDGSAMDSFFETGDFTFGGFYVNLLELLIEVERTGSYSLKVGVSTDRGATYTEKDVDLTTSSYAPSYTMRLNFNISTDRFRLRVRINDKDKPFEVHNLYAIYQLEEVRGSIK